MIQGSYRLLIPSWFPKGGMAVHENNNGATVIWLHHSADPKKDDDWANDASKAFPGGRYGAHWRAEMDGDFGARLGGLVFPQFSRNTHVIPRYQPEEWQWKCRVIDPGYNHPCAVSWFAIDGDGTVILYRTYRERGMTVPKIAAAIKAMSAKENYQYTLIDNAAFAKTLAGGGQNIAQQFAAEGIFVNPAAKPEKKDQISALARLIDLQDNGQPRFKVAEDCEPAISELLDYRWRDSRHDDLPNSEEPVKERDDIVDTCLYLAVSVDPAKTVDSQRRRDPLAQWYTGSDWRRQLADQRRMHSAMRKMVSPDQEP